MSQTPMNTAEEVLNALTEAARSGDDQQLQGASFSSNTVDIDDVRGALNQTDLTTERTGTLTANSSELNVELLGDYLRLVRSGGQDLEMRQAVLDNIADFLNGNEVNGNMGSEAA